MSGTDSLLIIAPCRLEWRELARKVQNVREDSSARRLMLESMSYLRQRCD